MQRGSLPRRVVLSSTNHSAQATVSSTAARRALVALPPIKTESPIQKNSYSSIRPSNSMFYLNQVRRVFTTSTSGSPSGRQGETISPSLWSTNSGIVIASIIGAMLGAIVVWGFEYFGFRGETTRELEKSRAPETKIPLPTDVEIRAVKEAFISRGLSVPSDELATWFFLASNGEEVSLSPRAQEELKILVVALSHLKEDESKSIAIPEGFVAVVATVDDNKRIHASPTVLSPGNHSLRPNETAFLLSTTSIEMNISVLQRTSNPREKDARELFKVVLRPQADKLPELVSKFGKGYADRIVPALADTIADEINAEIAQGIINKNQFAAEMKRRLTSECAESGLIVEELLEVKTDQARKT